MEVNRPTTKLNNKMKNLNSPVIGPDSFRIKKMDVDFKNNNVNNTKISSNSLSNIDAKSSENSYQLLGCKVVLDDVFSSSSTEKFKTLKLNPEKTHSVSSRQALEKHFLENLSKKDPIAWPSMKNDIEWERLDSLVGNNLTTGSPSVFDRIALLEETIYSKGLLLFGPVLKKQKQANGLNRRARHCIQLVKEKNNLLSLINSATEPSVKHSLIPLLEQVKSKL